jgi:hypothetical protein
MLEDDMFIYALIRGVWEQLACGGGGGGNGRSVRGRLMKITSLFERQKLKE